MESGNSAAADQLLPLVYRDLRRMAAEQMSREAPGQTLQPTALVHEAWLQISKQNSSWKCRRQFLAVAAESMRRILIDRARKRRREKHGGKLQKIELPDLEGLDIAANTGDETLLLLDEALQKFSAVDPVGFELVRLRFFVGLSNVEAAGLLGLGERTAKRTWAYARAWLYEEIRRQL